MRTLKRNTAGHPVVSLDQLPGAVPDDVGGLLIYWSNAVYRLGVGRYTLFSLFPEPFFQALGIPYRLAEGMSLHFFFMWFFAINGVLYVVYTLVSGEWRQLVPNRRSFREAIQVALHDLRLSKVEPPRRKFNGAQQIAYTTIILMGAGSLLTGVAIYKPVQFAWLTNLLGGYEWVRWEHFWLTAGYVLFSSSMSCRLPEPAGATSARWSPATKSRPCSTSRRSFLVLGLSATAGFAGWKWLTTRPGVGGLPCRCGARSNSTEALAERYFEDTRLAPTFPRASGS